MSSSMNNFMEAYKAVHNTESREELKAKRDWISEMNLGPLLQNDLIDIAEEVVLHLFKEGLTVKEAKDLVYGSLSDERRQDRVSRIVEAFQITFNKVDDRAPVIAREAFEQYLHGKKLQQNKSIMNSLDESKARVHRHTVAGDVAQVKEGLIRIFNEKKLDAVGSEDADIDNDGDVDSSDKYLHKRRKAIGKAMGKDKKDVKEGHDKSYLETDMKKRQKNNEKARKEMEKVKGQKNPHFEEYDNTKPDPKVTAEKKARLEKKRGMKLDDHPEYKESTDFEELLRTSGKFSENEILKILSDL